MGKSSGTGCVPLSLGAFAGAFACIRIHLRFCADSRVALVLGAKRESVNFCSGFGCFCRERRTLSLLDHVLEVRLGEKERLLY
jgi:hypothetical protein